MIILWNEKQHTSYTHRHAPDVRYVWSAAVCEPMCSIPSHTVHKHQDVPSVYMPSEHPVRAACVPNKKRGENLFHASKTI